MQVTTQIFGKFLVVFHSSGLSRFRSFDVDELVQQKKRRICYQKWQLPLKADYLYSIERQANWGHSEALRGIKEARLLGLQLLISKIERLSQPKYPHLYGAEQPSAFLELTMWAAVSATSTVRSSTSSTIFAAIASRCPCSPDLQAWIGWTPRACYSEKPSPLEMVLDWRRRRLALRRFRVFVQLVYGRYPDRQA